MRLARTTRVRLLALSALLGVGAAACGRPPAPPASLVVGVSLPMTGADAEVGAEMRRGYARAFEEINAAGGLRVAGTSNRVRIGLELRDDAGDPALAEAKAEELIRAGCEVLLGTATSVRSAMQAAVANRLERPYVVNSTDAPGLPGGNQRWVFTLPVSGEREARAYETARAVVRALERTTRFDAAGLRRALASLQSPASLR